ncbi:MAG TPA: anti-sigma factor [Roseiflexaceae bacterium]|nr:anti-sigma factor [Roseiflexaceae bacterium]
MLTNDHPQDSIPAFVLGTLDIDEARLVSAHVAQCPACRAEIETFQELLSALPYASAPRQPPPYVKRQLLARIAASQIDTVTTQARSPANTAPRWMPAVMSGALALWLVFGYMLYNTNSRMATIGGELTNSQQSIIQLSQQHSTDQTTIAQISAQRQLEEQALAGMQTQIAIDQQVMVFIAAPETIHRILGGPDQHARATMYMQPSNNQAVLVVEGMPRIEPGKIYQFWLSRAGEWVPSVTFDMTNDDRAVQWIEAAAPVDQYARVMVTIEVAGGAKQPSDKVVLSGSLSASPPASASQAD